MTDQQDQKKSTVSSESTAKGTDIDSEKSTENSSENSTVKKSSLDGNPSPPTPKTDSTASENPSQETLSAQDEVKTQENSKVEEDQTAEKKQEEPRKKTGRTRQRKKADESTRKPSKFPIFLSVFAFFIAIAAVAAAAFLYVNQQRLVEKLAKNEGIYSSQVSQLDKKVSQTNGSTQELWQQHRETKTQINRLHQQLTYNTKKLAEIPGTTKEDWKLAEVEYLLRLANQRILLERDPAGAYALLTSADGVLKSLGNPDLFSVRERINQDLIKLQMVKQFDREGVFLRIQSLMGQIDDMPYLPSIETVKSHEITQVYDNLSEESHWTDKLLSLLKPFVRFGKEDVVLEPLLTPQQHYYLQQNLRLMLEQVQLAVIKEEQRLYYESLKKANEWVKQYFAIHDQRVQIMSQHIEELMQIQVRPNLPNISSALHALLDHMDQRFPKPILENPQSPETRSPAVNTAPSTTPSLSEGAVPNA